MPFDGVVAKAVADELNRNITGGRIYKVYQPEKDTLLLYIRSNNRNVKLLLSSNANTARLHMTEIEYENPASPPMFCMLLRKHLIGGTIVGIDFSNYERIIGLLIEADDELGDRSVKKLIIEIMGRHSNIILVNEGGKIIDAIKHVDQDVNRVREIMPARTYILPPAQDKTIPSRLDVEAFIGSIREDERPLSKILLSTVLGFSPVLCREICIRACVDPDMGPKYHSENNLQSLIETLKHSIDCWEKETYTPCVVLDSTGKAVDFHAVLLTQYGKTEPFTSISEAIDRFHKAREMKVQVRNKAADLIHLVKTNLERCDKKIRIHVATLDENANLDNYRLYGELITANIYNLKKGMDHCSLLNYYANEEAYLEIALDENRTPQENAQWYFKKYNKAKNAHAYASEQLKLSRRELEYLENVLYSLEEADSSDTIEEIREELRGQGYVHKTNTRRRNVPKSSPFVLTSSEGYPIWVGRNNMQNDELTLKFAKPGDMWLHTKNIPGSHVVTRIPDEIPDKTLLEAAAMAAWFSKARNSTRVEVDYTRVKYVKKPSGAKPGMVIYVNYNTVIVDPLSPPESS
ncbi:MAG: NFACT family protein [Thermoclostridium sp.]|nr:NFACT family protein [Thermoclostridium sp.]